MRRDTKVGIWLPDHTYWPVKIYNFEAVCLLDNTSVGIMTVNSNRFTLTSLIPLKLYSLIKKGDFTLPLATEQKRKLRI